MALGIGKLAGGSLIVASALFLLALPAPTLASQAARSSPLSQGSPPTMSHCPKGLATPATDGQFRVYACNDGPSAVPDEKKALADLYELYPPEVRLMGFPVPDYQEPHENGRIDVYLVTPGQALTREGKTSNLQTDPGCPCGGEAPWDAIDGTVSSGYIVVLRPGAAGQYLNSILAHELFHVLQFSHNTTRSCRGFWFLEASAFWAEWWFAPSTANTRVYPYVRKFQATPGESLIVRNSYEDWMWPLFMQQQAGLASIASAWTAMDGKTGCDALNGAVNLQVPFHTYFDDFAVENFDSQLANLATNVPAWPDNFGADYPDWAAAANPAVPGTFPEIMPTAGSVTPSQASYPYTATVPVNLPPLSAQYTQIPLVLPYPGVSGGGSVEFDFSGLSPAGNADVSLLAADGLRKGGATNNGTWQRIDLGGGDTQAKICLNADATKKNHALKGAFYVIIDNHSSGPSAAPVTGSYTVTQRTTCASELSGALKVSMTETAGGGYNLHQTATLNVTLASAALFPGFSFWSLVPGKSTWSEQYKLTEDCGGLPGTVTYTASGGGPIHYLADVLRTVTLGTSLQSYLYWQPYFVKPSILGELLGDETAPGTYSGCGTSGSYTQPMMIGFGCPATYPPAPNDFHGVYTAADAGIDLDCSGTHTDKQDGSTYTVNISGTLTATDPIQCGLWTKNCSIGSKALTRKSRQ